MFCNDIAMTTLLHVPGFIGVSPVNISLRLKSVGEYLGFCQNQRRLRFTTTLSRSMESLRLDTGISTPPTSTSSTKFLVAAANISQLDANTFVNRHRVKIHSEWSSLITPSVKILRDMLVLNASVGDNWTSSRAWRRFGSHKLKKPFGWEVEMPSTTTRRPVSFS